VKTISSGLEADFKAEVTTMNTCLKITRTDAAAFYFTDCDQPIVFGGHTYDPVDGYSPTQSQTSADLSVDHSEVIAYLQSSSFTEADVMAGKWDDALVQMFMVNRKAVGHGAYEMRFGLLGQVSITSPGEYHAELRGITQWMQKPLGHQLTPTCRWTLGDLSSAGAVPRSHCTVDLAALAVTAVPVTSVVSNQVFHASSLAQPDTYFSMGFLTWTTGANSGRSMDIQGSALSGGTIVMQLPMLNNISIGDQFTIYPGCMKRFVEDCVVKFNNGINHGGVPKMKGVDSMMRPGGV